MVWSSCSHCSIWGVDQPTEPLSFPFSKSAFPLSKYGISKTKTRHSSFPRRKETHLPSQAELATLTVSMSESVCEEREEESGQQGGERKTPACRHTALLHFPNTYRSRAGLGQSQELGTPPVLQTTNREPSQIPSPWHLHHSARRGR